MITNKNIETIKTGDFRHEIIIQKLLVDQVDAGGGRAVDRYQDVCSAWAYIKSVSQAEQFRFQKFDETATHQVLIRYDAAVEAGMFIKFGSRMLTILGPPNNWEEKDLYLLMTCSEVS